MRAHPFQPCAQSTRPDNAGTRRGFTLLELLVVTAIIAILAGLLLPVLGRAKQKAQGIQCMSNLRQIQFGWQMYADDYSGNLVPNWGNAQAGLDVDKPSWAAGWMDYTGSTDNTNTDYLINPGAGDRPYGALLGSYNRQAKIYRCPADHSWVEIAGNRYERVRSVSMNMYMNANWLGPSAKEGLAAGFTLFRRLSDFVNLPPANGFVLLDEHEDSINGPGFVVDVVRTGADSRLLDVPASYHNRACGFSFADGHSEIHKWRDDRTVIPVTRQDIATPPTHFPAPFSQDIRWLQERSSAQ
jgi:prepilin-type N-terminal cleavage/methylation domain-containing protein/prepilin-type processing-associated H-X9-DG protein